ncbi:MULTISPECIES: integration host factor, actinobacterial type [Aeromicrobium]|uniref:integration host factor, actinobacterial type n=1 Tax=Aeromicrobium TaxID=2040 RepID=UPI0007016EC5|nr:MULTISPECIES: integration host factor, actinobacterial type [Aeromicrobium]KQX75659.1 30S ribosomal protein S13 [Aeromicrobium sp. Root472D3]MCL8252580.1 30S ribosomal protein S13 [Aeromicrobium fastidiosum]
MALPILTPDQRRAALQKAAAARQARADVKVRLKAAETTLAAVIDESRSDEVVAKLRVVDLLQAMPGVGAVRAREIMQRIGIADSRRLRGLGAKQVEGLLAEFADRPGRAGGVGRG